MKILPDAAPFLNQVQPAPISDFSQAESAFGSMLKTLVNETNLQQQVSDQRVQQVHGGGEKNLHEAMIAIEKADISLRYMVQVRNKALEAYQEIMRMQV
ncbi:flagellar hook-basal body complex protein FliE [Desulfobulbus alkaliphilus]|uniref:flagellar hook-basal body complex protein FliE n=1 Tax=Desulfobulbus alkaliphilus TaxID=869814 RepID=UPI00196498B5|nr:flagellar hook-basal body complex protein FliE [Desulfobulbus alkaliphilus]MBM9537437.1 flagellar hook-basal body complex protein FliE [Desulfobulbus alkaliphilus]